MESVAPDMHDVRQGGAGDHLSAICSHLWFFFAALFGSRAAAPPRSLYAPPNAQEEVPSCILKPTSPRKERWDLLIMTLILYSAGSVPIRVCFNSHADGLVWYFEAGMSVVFMVDVVLAFHTAYQQDGQWIYDRARIARAYLLGWFWVDGPSAVPVELLEVVLEWHEAAEEARGAKDVTTLAILRFLRMFRLFRLLRLLKVREYVTRLEEAFMVNLRILKLLEIFVKLGFIAHILGCGWFYMHLIAADDEPTWVSEYDGGSALEGPISKQYLYSLYWSLTTMSTVGYGDITPANDRERAFATASLVVGALTFAFINGNVVNLLSTLDNQSALVEEKLEAVKEYVQWRSLPKDLVIRIRRYYEHYYTRRAVFDESDILTQLNPQLHAEVVHYILNDSLGQLPLFQKLNPDFKLEMFPLLKPISFAPGDLIYKKGAPSRTIYFLLSGEIDIYRGIGKQDLLAAGAHGATPTSRITPWHETDLLVETDWTGHAPTSSISRGGETLLARGTATPVAPRSAHEGIFGQAALMGRRREATAIARTNCEALLISRDDLQKLFEGDAVSARRLCVLVLEDFLRMDRLAMLALRLRVVSAAQGSEMRAVLTIQYHWRRFNDRLARANDPIYEHIDKDGHLSSTARWAARSLHRSSTRKIPLVRAGARGGGRMAGGGGAARRDEQAAMTYVMAQKIDEIKEILVEMKSRIERLEETTPRKGGFKKGLSGVGSSWSGSTAAHSSTAAAAERSSVSA